MKNQKLLMKIRIPAGALLLTFCLASTPPSAGATTIDQYPYPGDAGYGWPTASINWIAIPSLNDPDDGVTDKLDFVGDATDPGGYIAWDENYVYFRQRVDIGTVAAGTYVDSTFVMIDSNNDSLPDYAFAWDTNGNKLQEKQHGLEFTIPDVIGSTWATTCFDDYDGSSGQKLIPPDFNRAGDGYIRTVDSVTTTNFGTTTFIDTAVSWAYLASEFEGNQISSLAPDQTWRIQFGSVENATDHALITADVAGNSNPTDAIVWSSPIYVGDGGGGGDVPEPSTLLLLLPFIGFGLKALREKRFMKP
jgi:hypothetical protein